MRITDLVKVDPEYRLLRKAQTLETAIIQRLQYHYKHNKAQIRQVHVNRADELVKELRERQNQTSRLDRDEFISHSVIGAPLLRLPVKVVMDWVFTDLRPPGRAQHDPLTQIVIEQMNEAGKTQRAATHQTTLAYEIAYRTEQGWFALFNTLTVREGAYYTVFSKDSTAFQEYIRKADRLFAQAAYGSIRNAHKQEYHTYFAVVEEGSKNGRLHIHVLHLFQTLPRHIDDPNKAKPLPSYREISDFRYLWPHGFSTPIAVRYSPQDAYGKKGWRWPYDSRTDAPLLIGSPLALAGYLSKYITKSYKSNKRDKLLWRVKKTHNLGRPLVEELLSTLTPLQLIAVATDPSLNQRLNSSKTPPEMLRLAALRRYNKLRGQFSTSLLPSLRERAKGLQPRPSPLHASRASTHDLTISSQENIGHILTHNALSEDTFNETHAALSQAYDRINKKYFRTSPHAFGTTSTRDHIYAAALVNAETR